MKKVHRAKASREMTRRQVLRLGAGVAAGAAVGPFVMRVAGAAAPVTIAGAACDTDTSRWRRVREGRGTILPAPPRRVKWRDRR